MVGGPQYPYRPDWLQRPTEPTPFSEPVPDTAPQQAPPASRLSWRLLLVIALLSFLGGVGGAIAAGLALHLVTENGDQVTVPGREGESQLISRIMVQEESAITEVVKQALPAVVTIVNDQRPRRDDRGREIQETAVGTGFIIDPRGFIVTNEHVVRDAQRLRVVLSTGEERPAVVISDDRPFTDIAVLKIQEGGLTVLPVGDSDGLSPGQRVIAIGNSLYEFRSTVTTGVISGLHRRWLRDGVIMEDLIQTDAAINHGNSGGPLLNLKGEVIGITTTVIRGTDGGQNVEGIGLAISSHVFAPIAEAIIKNGRYPRPYDGIVHRDIDAVVARANNLPSSRGAYVLQVRPGTPAERAGIRPGDIILRVGSFDLHEEMPYINALARLRPDERVPFLINRGGRELTIDITLASR